MKRFLQSLFLSIIAAIALSCGQKDSTPQPQQQTAANQTQPNSAPSVPGPAPSVAAKPAEAIDPCLLITKAEAEELFKGEMANYSDPPTKSDRGTESKCTYVTPTGYLQIITFAPATSAQFESLIGQAKADQKVKVEILSGIGEQAFVIGKDARGTLYMLKASMGVKLSLQDKRRLPAEASADKSLQTFSEDLKTLAIKVASRIR
jgi:hypothetical protein